MSQVIYYADAHAGSGKTHSLHQHIKKLDGQATIATQTNILSDQQSVDLAKIGIASHVISGQTVSDSCNKQYARHSKDGRDSVALINQNLIKQLQEAATYRHLFVDEIFSPVERCELIEEISASWQFISKLVSNAVETEFEGVLEILSTDDTKEIAKYGAIKKSSMTALPHVRELCQWTESEHRRVFVITEAYKNFTSNIKAKNSETADNGEGHPNDHSRKTKNQVNRKLKLYAFLQPTIFGIQEHAPTIMGANYKQSKLFLYWNSMVNFVPHPEITGTRYEDFAHKSDLIDIRPCSEVHISGRFLHEKVGYEYFCESVADAFAAEYGDVSHLVSLNAKQPFDWKLANGEEVPPNPVGLNGLMTRRYAVHLATLNPSNEDAAIWLAVAGVTKDQLMIAQAYEMMYQFLTRSAVRDNKRHDKERIVFIVLDRQAADYLCDVFGAAKGGELFKVPALTNYKKPARKTRSDKMPSLSDEDQREKDRVKKATYRAKLKAANQAAASAIAA